MKDKKSIGNIIDLTEKRKEKIIKSKESKRDSKIDNTFNPSEPPNC